MTVLMTTLIPVTSALPEVCQVTETPLANIQIQQVPLLTPVITPDVPLLITLTFKFVKILSSPNIPAIIALVRIARRIVACTILLTRIQKTN
jgi:hypothetical protein